LPHIPNTEKVEKISRKGINAVGSISPRMHDTVYINLVLETLDEKEILSSDNYPKNSFYLKISSKTVNTCWSKLLTHMKAGERI